MKHEIIYTYVFQQALINISIFKEIRAKIVKNWDCIFMSTERWKRNNKHVASRQRKLTPSSWTKLAFLPSHFRKAFTCFANFILYFTHHVTTTGSTSPSNKYNYLNLSLYFCKIFSAVLMVIVQRLLKVHRESYITHFYYVLCWT